MRSFDIDLYLWEEEISEWLFLPAGGSVLKWPFPPGVTQHSILSGTAGLTFRVDDVLWLGNERDGLPLEMIVFALEQSKLGKAPGASLMSLPVGEHLSIQVNQSEEREDVLVSRLCTRNANDYLERTAVATGSYFKDFPVNAGLWKRAVNQTLDGLAVIFAGSTPLETGAKRPPLATWLLDRHEALVKKS